MADTVVAFQGWGASGVPWGSQGWGVGYVNLTATSSLGTVQGSGGAIVSPTGISATGYVGDVTVFVGSGVTVPVTGLSFTGYLGSVNVWGLVDDVQTPNWTNIPDTQTPLWTPVPDVQSPNWQQIVV